MEEARPAATADLHDIARLMQLARAEMLDQRGGPLWLAAEGRGHFDVTVLPVLLDDPDQLLAVGTLDATVVAYLRARTATLAGAPGGMAVIHELYVEPEAREVGVGEVLMEHVLAWAADRGCAGVDAFALPGSRALKNLFERYGLVARAILVHRPLGAAL